MPWKVWIFRGIFFVGFEAINIQITKKYFCSYISNAVISKINDLNNKDIAKLEPIAAFVPVPIPSQITA